MLQRPKRREKKKIVVTFAIAVSIPVLTEVVIAIAKVAFFIYRNYPAK